MLRGSGERRCHSVLAPTWGGDTATLALRSLRLFEGLASDLPGGLHCLIVARCRTGNGCSIEKLCQALGLCLKGRHIKDDHIASHTATAVIIRQLAGLLRPLELSRPLDDAENVTSLSPRSSASTALHASASKTSRRKGDTVVKISSPSSLPHSGNAAGRRICHWLSPLDHSMFVSGGGQAEARSLGRQDQPKFGRSSRQSIPRRTK